MAKVKVALTPVTDKAVATAGTRVQLSATSLMVAALVIQWHPSNNGDIYVGDVTVAAGKCLILNSSNPVLTLSPEQNLEDDDPVTIDLADIYIDAATSGDKVKLAYVQVTQKSFNG